MRQFWFLVALICCLGGSAMLASACLWDYDTLAMERQQFPSTLELITGKFLRHSNEFYEWRVRDRQKRIDSGESRPELYDDLAAACDKLGRHDEAIATIQKKDTLFPGLYETHANLGTFLIHSGKLEEGLVELDKAIAINPDAHFGREVYQKLLVEYLLERRTRPSVPTAEDLELYRFHPHGFVRFVLRRRNIEDSNLASVASELRKAIDGIQGMMKFGKHDSPVLLEVLGELLLAQDRERNSWIACRAFLKAADAGKESLCGADLEVLATGAISMKRRLGTEQQPYTVAEIRQQLTREVDEANAWFSRLRADEMKWIESGLNADEMFTKTYYDDPVAVAGEPYWAAIEQNVRYWKSFILIGAIVALWLVWKISRRVRTHLPAVATIRKAETNSASP